MDAIKNVCRICLQDNAGINWNDELKEFDGISYKSCYYKYTQLKEPDAECYPTNLCAKCADELQNVHIFFGHALESFKILQNTFKVKEPATENILLKSSSNSEGIVCDTLDSSFINAKEHSDIDEVICYSPLSDVVGTESKLYESPLPAAIEQQTIDDYAKIRNSLFECKKESPRKKHIDSYETTLELNLQLEIHGSNLLKSTIKKTTKPSRQRLIKNQRKANSGKPMPQQAVQCSVPFERVHDTNQQLSRSETLHSNAEYLRTNDLNGLEGLTNDPLAESLLDVNSSESINDTVPSNAKPLEQKESSVAKTPGRKRDLAEYVLFLKQFNRSDISLSVDSVAHLKSKELQELSIAEQKKKPSEQSVNPFLEEPFAKEGEKDDLRVFEPQKEKQIMCQYCSKVFISVYKAVEHEQTHLENRERKETCTKCGLKFYNKNSLRSHMYTHKENREKNLKCEFCGKAFYNHSSLNVHRRIHIGPKIPCSICPKEYYRQSDLDKHLVSHSATRVDGDLKYKKKYFVYCEICGNEVRTVHYKSHIARHNNEPLAKCAVCNKEFFSRASCSKHVQHVHRKGIGEINNFVISYKTEFFSKLFLEQKTGTLFTKEKL